MTATAAQRREPLVFTEAEWNAEGERRFGPDKEKWAFKCFSCGNVMSIARARAEFPQLKGSGWAPHEECIGRYIDVPAAQRTIGKGKRAKRERCDWCAYGFFAGPVTVTMPEGHKIHVFEFGPPTIAEGATPP